MSSKQNEWAAEASCQGTQGPAEGYQTSYPFLVHSQESLSQQTPPDVDNQRLARQKRRRTSPEDHAILEGEYERNSKPDKAARLEIVKKVALGEKEVQIWFQNRRQVTRRKSRPLLPHEGLANLQPASQNLEQALSSSNPIDESSQQRASWSQSSMTNGQSQQSDVYVRLSGNASRVGGAFEQAHSDHASKSAIGTSREPRVVNLCQEGNAGKLKASFLDTKAAFKGVVRSEGPHKSLSQTLPRKRGPEASGIRRRASFTIHDDGGQASQKSASASTIGYTEQAVSSKDVAKSSQPPKRTSSLVRLSMSLHGKAQVTTSTGTTPSPPRPHPVPLSDPVRRPNLGLQRSFSAIELSKKESPGGVPNPFFKRPATGRSRDARTWEFYCDKETRDALTEQAEREESGSATAAIALIKSNSNTSKTATAKSNKRNANNQKLEAAKRLKANGETAQKPKLSRSQSSFANMQTVSKNRHSREDEVGKIHRKSGSQSAVFELYEGDSDKENWMPGTQQRSPLRRRPARSSQSRRILEESLSHSVSLGALMSQERAMSRRPSYLKSTSTSTGTSISEDKENGTPEIDDEVAAFMGDAAAPREADDLDCVQNLLSLSQAAWQ